ncbi:MAG: SIR2 family protein [Chloroflexi bacterium]|nr:SIR2 family protein [Chloroflexota bacterium]
MRIPVELLEHIEKRKVVLLLGPGINEGTPASPKALATILGERLGIADGETRPLNYLVDCYVEQQLSPFDLIQVLIEAIASSQPSGLHHQIAKLIGGSADIGGPLIKRVVTLCYDDLLERALREHGVQPVPMVKVADFPFREEEKTQIVHLWGKHDSAESLVVTDERRGELLVHKSDGLLEQIRGELFGNTWLCLGVDLDDEWFQSLYRTVVLSANGAPQPPYACGVLRDELSRLRWSRQKMQVLATDLSVFLDELIRQLDLRARRQAESRLAEAPAVKVIAPIFQPPPRLPYKGLRYYEDDDAALFFGRDADTYYLLNQVRGNRLTILTGPSGAGKSSLLYAGVVPYLKQDGLKVAKSRLFGEPLHLSVNRSVYELAPDILPGPTDERLPDYLDNACKLLGQEIVLIIDQFEELFARPLTNQTREDFLDQLMAIVRNRLLPVHVVLSLRSDWVHHLHVLARWLPEFSSYQVPIERLNRNQARQAIISPLESLGIPYEEQLVDRIIDDLVQTARDDPRMQGDTTLQDVIDPPQLQLVCDALYEPGSLTGLDSQTYKARDGARGILKRYLHRKLATYGPDQEFAERALIALIGPNNTKEARTSEQIQLEVTEPAAAERVLARLVQDRLVRPDVREHKVYYELAHEYLVGEIELTPEVLNRKRAQYWLQQGADEWFQHRGALLSEDQFRIINAEREYLRPHLEERPRARSLLLRCALEYSCDIDYWLNQIETPAKKEVLLDTLQSCKDHVSKARSATLLGAILDSDVENVLLTAALHDEAALVRRTAARSLSGCSPQSKTHLRLKAQTDAGAEGICALEALGYSASADDVSLLMAVAAGRDALRRCAAISALNRLRMGFSFRWLWLRNRDTLLSDVAVFLTTALGLLVGLHYLVITWLGTGTAWLTSPLRLAVLRNPILLSYRLQWPLALLALAAVLVIVMAHFWFRAIKRTPAFALFGLVLMAGGANFMYQPFEGLIAQAQPEQFYNRAEYELTVAGDLAMARRLFAEVRPYSKERVLAEAWLAGVSYLEGNYAQAIREACTWLAYDRSVTPSYEETALNLITTVHWSIYQLGYNRTFDEALELREGLLKELKESHPTSRCVVEGELSPFFLGISPTSRAFIIELADKYAPPPLYTYLGVLSGRPDLYQPPEGAVVNDDDRHVLTMLLTSPPYGHNYRDDQGIWHGPDKYAAWGAFLVGDYTHPALRNSWGWIIWPPNKAIPLVEAAALGLAVQGLSDDPAEGIARLNAYLDPSNPYRKYLLSSDSPWLDDIYALMMYLWNQQGDQNRALEYYAKLLQRANPESRKLLSMNKHQVLCQFCTPGAVIGLGMSTADLGKLMERQDSIFGKAACDEPYLLDLIGLRQLADGQYEGTKATFRRLAEQCEARYPDRDASDYLRVVSLLEDIAKSPTQENYRRYFTTMDQSWTWNYKGPVPLPKAWFLARAVELTSNWPMDVSLKVNPWITYARSLEEYAGRFAEYASTDVRIPASLLQAAWLYDSLSDRPRGMLAPNSEDEYKLILRELASKALLRYLESYYGRQDIPLEFCRYYRLYQNRPNYPSRYNVTQDCVIEWLALLHLGEPGSEYATIRHYSEPDIIAMQEQARKLIERYPQHHLANNLLNWIAWGYCYLFSIY